MRWVLQTHEYRAIVNRTIGAMGKRSGSSKSIPRCPRCLLDVPECLRAQRCKGCGFILAPGFTDPVSPSRYGWLIYPLLPFFLLTGATLVLAWAYHGIFVDSDTLLWFLPPHGLWPNRSCAALSAFVALIFAGIAVLIAPACFRFAILVPGIHALYWRVSCRAPFEFVPWNLITDIQLRPANARDELVLVLSEIGEVIVPAKVMPTALRMKRKVLPKIIRCWESARHKSDEELLSWNRTSP
jgi:hypothetical protein